MSAQPIPPTSRTPQQVCQHNPCWCGRPLRHQLGEYDAEKTAKWLADREAARQATVAKP